MCFKRKTVHAGACVFVGTDHSLVHRLPVSDPGVFPGLSGGEGRCLREHVRPRKPHSPAQTAGLRHIRRRTVVGAGMYVRYRPCNKGHILVLWSPVVEADMVGFLSYDPKPEKVGHDSYIKFDFYLIPDAVNRTKQERYFLFGLYNFICVFNINSFLHFRPAHKVRKPCNHDLVQKQNPQKVFQEQR